MEHENKIASKVRRDIGCRIGRVREKRGLTQSALASLIGESPRTITHWENATRDIRTEGLIALSKALGVSADYILGLTDVETSNQTIQAIHKETGLSEAAIRRLSIDHLMGGEYFSLLSAIVSHDLLPQLMSIFGRYISDDEYLDGCAEIFISQLTMYDDALDERLAQKALYKKIAEEYLWKIVDECGAEEE